MKKVYQSGYCVATDSSGRWIVVGRGDSKQAARADLESKLKLPEFVNQQLGDYRFEESSYLDGQEA